MDSSVAPPESVRGMLELDRNKFSKSIKVPCLRLPQALTHFAIRIVTKAVLLKLQHLQPIRKLDDGVAELLLHPGPIKSWSDLPVAKLEAADISSSRFHYADLTVSYENWTADEILKSVLPSGNPGVSGYSMIGHIVHLNLRDQLLRYKHIIAQVLLDKIPNCRTVVNKSSIIDNTYRNFNMELLRGEPEYLVETKEHGRVFEFDFSKVYWNPRLATEHQRIVNMLNRGDVLYDVFAGVGPFSVPAGKKGCAVLANDLNPESYRWLQVNVKRNKCTEHVRCFNKDGRDFMLGVMRANILERWKQGPNDYALHITMNLPAMAVDFIDSFRGLFSESDADFSSPQLNYPLVHVYTFVKGADPKLQVLAIVESKLGLPLAKNLIDIHLVRNVAPNKDMYRVSFRLTLEILTTTWRPSKSSLKRGPLVEAGNETGPNNPKVICL